MAKKTARNYGKPAYEIMPLGTIVTQAQRCAEYYGLHPSTLKLSILIRWSKERSATTGKLLHPPVIKRDDVKSYGFWPTIRHDAFGDAPAGLDLEAKRSLQRRRHYVRWLERREGDRELFLARAREAFVLAARDYPIKLSKSPAWVGKGSAKPASRTIHAFVSDVHAGALVDPLEVPGHRLSWEITCRRMAYFATQVAEYKAHYRDSTDLHVFFGGDLGQGVIHQDDRGQDLFAAQIIGGMHLWVAFLDFLAQHFRTVHTHWTPCNHMRWTHKGPGRATAQKWDGAAYVLAHSVRQGLRTNPRVTFDVPMTPYVTWQAQGHKFLGAHGDTNPHMIKFPDAVNLKAIELQIRRISDAPGFGKAPDAVLLGHTHWPMATEAYAGVELVCNGTASGLGPFAQSIGFHRGDPKQVMFETVPGFAVGDFRKIDLRPADKQRKYNEIIPTPPTTADIRVRP